MLLMEVFNTKNHNCLFNILRMFHIKVLIVSFSYYYSGTDLSLETDPLRGFE